MVGMAVSTLSALLVIYLFVRRIILGPEAEGVFTLFGVVFFFIGLALFGIGLLGEYVGRIYAQVRERPRYIIEGVLEAPHAENEPNDPGRPSYTGADARAHHALPHCLGPCRSPPPQSPL